MCNTVEEGRTHVLALLLRGRSPEQVEEIIDQASGCVLEAVQPLTALTDPNNVLMQEVTEDGAAPRPR
jgi:hypothetical protein